MTRHPSRPHLDLPSERTGELIQVEHAMPRLSVVAPAGAAELQRLLAAINDENRNLSAHVRRLEAELRSSSAELARVRGDLRSAVRDALTDPLTGLANRRSFDLKLEAVVARTGRASPAHLVMADVDHLKRINDNHGHGIGDEVLRIVGAVLLANVRSDSVVARVGGDEFGLLLPGADARYTARIAKRLCERLASRPLVVRGFPGISEQITLSIGVARWHAGDDGARWFARADAALYGAKQRGRNQVAVDRHPQPASGGPPPEAHDMPEAPLANATNRG